MLGHNDHDGQAANMINKVVAWFFWRVVDQVFLHSFYIVASIGQIIKISLSINASLVLLLLEWCKYMATKKLLAAPP